MSKYRTRKMKRLKQIGTAALRSSIGKPSHNPQPEIKVASVDLASTETITCPFFVGLTVEQPGGRFLQTP